MSEFFPFISKINSNYELLNKNFIFYSDKIINTPLSYAYDKINFTMDPYTQIYISVGNTDIENLSNNNNKMNFQDSFEEKVFFAVSKNIKNISEKIANAGWFPLKPKKFNNFEEILSYYYYIFSLKISEEDRNSVVDIYLIYLVISLCFALHIPNKIIYETMKDIKVKKKYIYDIKVQSILKSFLTLIINYNNEFSKSVMDLFVLKENKEKYINNIILNMSKKIFNWSQIPSDDEIYLMSIGHFIINPAVRIMDIINIDIIEAASYFCYKYFLLTTNNYLKFNYLIKLNNIKRWFGDLSQFNFEGKYLLSRYNPFLDFNIKEESILDILSSMFKILENGQKINMIKEIDLSHLKIEITEELKERIRNSFSEKELQTIYNLLKEVESGRGESIINFLVVLPQKLYKDIDIYKNLARKFLYQLYFPNNSHISDFLTQSEILEKSYFFNPEEINFSLRKNNDFSNINNLVLKINNGEYNYSYGSKYIGGITSYITFTSTTIEANSLISIIQKEYNIKKLQRFYLNYINLINFGDSKQKNYIKLEEIVEDYKYLLSKLFFKPYIYAINDRLINLSSLDEYIIYDNELKKLQQEKFTNMINNANNKKEIFPKEKNSILIVDNGNVTSLNNYLSYLISWFNVDNNIMSLRYDDEYWLKTPDYFHAENKNNIPNIQFKNYSSLKIWIKKKLDNIFTFYEALKSIDNEHLNNFPELYYNFTSSYYDDTKKYQDSEEFSLISKLVDELRIQFIESSNLKSLFKNSISLETFFDDNINSQLFRCLQAFSIYYEKLSNPYFFGEWVRNNDMCVLHNKKQIINGGFENFIIHSLISSMVSINFILSDSKKQEIIKNKFCINKVLTFLENLNDDIKSKYTFSNYFLYVHQLFSKELQLPSVEIILHNKERIQIINSEENSEDIIVINDVSEYYNFINGNIENFVKIRSIMYEYINKVYPFDNVNLINNLYNFSLTFLIKDPKIIKNLLSNKINENLLNEQESIFSILDAYYKNNSTLISLRDYLKLSELKIMLNTNYSTRELSDLLTEKFKRVVQFLRINISISNEIFSRVYHLSKIYKTIFKPRYFYPENDLDCKFKNHEKYFTNKDKILKHNLIDFINSYSPKEPLFQSIKIEEFLENSKDLINEAEKLFSSKMPLDGISEKAEKLIEKSKNLPSNYNFEEEVQKVIRRLISLMNQSEKYLESIPYSTNYSVLNKRSDSNDGSKYFSTSSSVQKEKSITLLDLDKTSESTISDKKFENIEPIELMANESIESIEPMIIKPQGSSILNNSKNPSKTAEAVKNANNLSVQFSNMRSKNKQRP